MSDKPRRHEPDLGEHTHMFLLDTQGGAWVTGDGSFSIPFRRRPRRPKAWFEDPPTCGPAPDPGDWVQADAVNTGHIFRPRWHLKVTWHVSSGVRLINWSTDN